MAQEPLEPTGALRARLDDLGLSFLSAFYEGVTRRQPANVEALAELGHVYTRQGRMEDGLRVDRQLVRLVPENPTVHYNLACSLAILDLRDEALDSLEQAVRLGYDDPVFMVHDDDLANLRPEHRFQDIVRRLEASTTGAETQD